MLLSDGQWYLPNEIESGLPSVSDFRVGQPVRACYSDNYACDFSIGARIAFISEDGQIYIDTNMRIPGMRILPAGSPGGRMTLPSGYVAGFESLTPLTE